MTKCKYCGIDAGTHACDPKDVTINMQKQDITILRSKVAELKDEVSDLNRISAIRKRKALAKTAKINELSLRMQVLIEALDSIASDIDTWHSDVAIEALNTTPNHIKETK